MRYLGSRKRLRSIFGIMVLTILLIGFCSVEASGAERSLKVSAGFYGGPYYEVETFSYEQMCEMAQEEVITYSGMDSGNFVSIAYAWGVPLDDLLSYSGIDVNSIKYFHMKTDDNYGENVTTFSAEDLLYTDRYFFPELARNAGQYGQLTEFTSEMNKNPVKVPAMLAINCTDYSRDEAVGIAKGANYKSYSDGAALSSDSRYRLIYGQTSVSGALSNGYNVQTSGKWISEIEVQLAGAPTITVDKNLISGEEGKVGSEYEVTVSINLPSSYSYLSASSLDSLKKQVLENITVSGYDEDVVKVESKSVGVYKVKITGEGNTQLEFKYSRSEYGGGITGAAASTGIVGISDGNGKGDDSEDNKGNGDDGGSGDNDREGDDNENKTGEGDGDSEEGGGGEKTPDINDNSGDKITLNDLMTSGAQEVSMAESPQNEKAKKTASSEAEDEEWVAFQVKNEIVDFSAEEDNNEWLGITGAMGAALLAFGAGGRIFLFLKAI